MPPACERCSRRRCSSPTRGGCKPPGPAPQPARSRASSSPSRLRGRALVCVKSSTLTLRTRASLSRPGRKASYPTQTSWTCWKPCASLGCWNEGSALTPAEALLQELGITGPEETDLEAIAYHVSARVRFRPLCGCEAHILACGGTASIPVKRGQPPRRKRLHIAH